MVKSNINKKFINKNNTKRIRNKKKLQTKKLIGGGNQPVQSSIFRRALNKGVAAATNGLSRVRSSLASIKNKSELSFTKFASYIATDPFIFTLVNHPNTPLSELIPQFINFLNIKKIILPQPINVELPPDLPSFNEYKTNSFCL